MQLIEIDCTKLNKKDFDYCHLLCNSVTRDPDHELYGLFDNGLKTLLVIHSNGLDLSTSKELEIATVPSERRKGYATESIRFVFALLKNRPDIKDIKIDAINKITNIIMNKFPCIRVDDNITIINNPYYKPEYEKLIKAINDGLYTREEIDELNNTISKRIKRWYIAFLIRKKYKEQVKKMTIHLGDRS